jgi:hypothetical protein
MPDWLGDSELLGRRVRSRNEGLRVREGPGSESAVVAELGPHTPFRVLGGNDERLRVALPDGRHGYVPLRLTEAADEAVAQSVVTMERSARSRPLEGAPLVEMVPAGTTLAVLGSYGGYLLVRAPSGRDAWVAADQD